jgi:hypothetical protein
VARIRSEMDFCTGFRGEEQLSVPKTYSNPLPLVKVKLSTQCDTTWLQRGTNSGHLQSKAKEHVQVHEMLLENMLTFTPLTYYSIVSLLREDPMLGEMMV